MARWRVAVQWLDARWLWGVWILNCGCFTESVCQLRRSAARCAQPHCHLSHSTNVRSHLKSASQAGLWFNNRFERIECIVELFPNIRFCDKL
jgi:hypothetical protein